MLCRRGRDMFTGEEPQVGAFVVGSYRQLRLHLRALPGRVPVHVRERRVRAQMIGTQSESPLPYADGTWFQCAGSTDPDRSPRFWPPRRARQDGSAVAAEAARQAVAVSVGRSERGVLAAGQLGAERYAMSRHPERQRLDRFTARPTSSRSAVWGVPSQDSRRVGRIGDRAVGTQV